MPILGINLNNVAHLWIALIIYSSLTSLVCCFLLRLIYNLVPRIMLIQYFQERDYHTDNFF